MNLNPDIKTCIISSSNQLPNIIEKIKTQQKSIPDDLQVDISNYLSNLRSALDYLAYQIFKDNCANNDEAIVYFPLYCKDNHAFESFMGKYFPDLKNLNPNIFSKLENFQYYNDPNDREWMKDLRIVNEYKHRGFPDQHRMESGFINVGTPESPFAIVIQDTCRDIKIKNNIVNGTRIPDMTINRGKVTLREPAKLDKNVMITKTTSGEFHFTKLDKPVVQTLSSILQGVQTVIHGFEN